MGTFENLSDTGSLTEFSVPVFINKPVLKTSFENLGATPEVLGSPEVDDLNIDIAVETYDPANQERYIYIDRESNDITLYIGAISDNSRQIVQAGNSLGWMRLAEVNEQSAAASRIMAYGASVVALNSIAQDIEAKRTAKRDNADERLTVFSGLLAGTLATAAYLMEDAAKVGLTGQKVSAAVSAIAVLSAGLGIRRRREIGRIFEDVPANMRRKHIDDVVSRNYTCTKMAVQDFGEPMVVEVGKPAKLVSMPFRVLELSPHKQENTAQTV